MIPNRRVPQPRPELPAPSIFNETPGLRAYLLKLVDVLVTELTRRATKTEPVPGVLLTAPNGKVFEVSVDNTGNLVTTERAS